MELVQSSSQGFRGTVNLQLTDLIQMVCLSRSDLTVCVRSAKGVGMIYVKEGQIYHAQTEFLQGEFAFYQILRWKDGQFEIHPYQGMSVTTVDKSWEYLLLEAMRQRDEEAEEAKLYEDTACVECGESPGHAALDGNVDLSFDQMEHIALQRSATAQAPQRELKILIVDDSSFFCRQLHRMLEHDPHIKVVGSAKNGKEALEILMANPDVDLITLDIQMPIMKGDTVLKHIMVRYQVPVLVVSAFQIQSARKVFEFLQIGAVDFLPKPEAGTDILQYGQNMRELVRRVANAKTAHFRRWRKSKRESEPAEAIEARSGDNEILVIAGAEGAYMDWLRLPLRRLCRHRLVIGLQKLPDSFLAKYSQLIQEGTDSTVYPIMHSEWLSSGGLFFGNAAHPVKIQVAENEASLGVEILHSQDIPWVEGVHLWLEQLAEQAGARMSACFLSAASPLSADLISRMLHHNVRLILTPAERLVCADLVDSIAPYSELHQEKILWATPENLTEVLSGNGQQQ